MIRGISVFLCTCFLAACSESSFDITVEEHQREVEEWQQSRAESLTAENGWLTLVGLCWLEPGSNTFGSDDDAACRVDYDRMPARLGVFDRDGEGNAVTFTVAEGIQVTTSEGEPVDSTNMIGDHHEGTTYLEHDTLRFYMIERFGELGIRVRDIESRARQEFAGLEYFPVDRSWRKIARFEPYDTPRHVPIINILGMRDDMRSPGELVFEHAGEEYRLIALADEGDSRWFIMVADATSGRTTYGAGRYIYVDPPQGDRTVLDFNKVYNPPCAFTELATCPLPPMQNRLPLAIEAGEKNYHSEDAWQASDSH